MQVENHAKIEPEMGYHDTWPAGAYYVEPAEYEGRTFYSLDIEGRPPGLHTLFEQNALVHLWAAAPNLYTACCAVLGFFEEHPEALAIPDGLTLFDLVAYATRQARATLPPDDPWSGEETLCYRPKPVRRGLLPPARKNFAKGRERFRAEEGIGE